MGRVRVEDGHYNKRVLFRHPFIIDTNIAHIVARLLEELIKMFEK